MFDSFNKSRISIVICTFPEYIYLSISAINIYISDWNVCLYHFWSSIDENVYDSNGYSATSTNLTTWVSQSSSSFTTIWGNNATEQIEAFTNGPSIAYSNLRAFTYAQLKAATHNFRRDMVVGKGGFGSVYKGWLKEKMMPRGIKKTAIAIKILSPASAQGAKEWKVCIFWIFLWMRLG